jgi:CDP-glucose 4,6-dehydratase
MLQNLSIIKNFSEKKVLITGHTGFKGLWLAMLLHELGAELHGVALPPLKSHPDPSLFSKEAAFFKTNRYADIRDVFLFDQLLEDIRPDFVFHLAAQPLVLKSYEDPNDTFTTNIVGCINLFDALRRFAVKHKGHQMTVINVTTDKVYRNDEASMHPLDLASFKGYSEMDPLGGDDPYSASKACSEIVASSFARSFLNKTSICLVNARSGNVIGGGDFCENRIIPDCIRAIAGKHELVIRNPLAIRPWQHVLDVVRGYAMLALQARQDVNELGQAFWNGQGFNLGPNPDDIRPWPVQRVVAELFSAISLDYKPDTKYIENESKKETRILLLNSAKAKRILNWDNALSTSKAIHMTAAWYQTHLEHGDTLAVTRRQVVEFLSQNPVKAKAIF